MEVPTIQLVERQRLRCRLPRDDVRYLMRHHRRHINVLPQRGNHALLCPRGYVGLIRTPNACLEIMPKIPASILQHMITGRGGESGNEPCNVVDILAQHLARGMVRQCQLGLRQDYQEVLEQGPIPKGRWHFPSHLRLQQRQVNQSSYVYEERTPDILENQIVKATAELLLGRGPLQKRSRNELAHALTGYQTVRAIVLHEKLFAEISPVDSSVERSSLLQLCHEIFLSLVMNDNMQCGSQASLLVSLESIFERYCCRRLAQSFAPGQVRIQPSQRFHGQQEPAAQLLMRPDLVLDGEGGKPHAVVDIKWKSKAPQPQDLYQVLAYCAGWNVDRGMLIYPGPAYHLDELPFRSGQQSILIAHVPVEGQAEELDSALDALAEILSKK